MDNFLTYIGLFVLVSFAIYLISKAISFNYSVVESMVGAKTPSELSTHAEEIKVLEDKISKLTKELNLPAEKENQKIRFGKLGEIMLLEEWKVLVGLSAEKSLSHKNILLAGDKLKAYREIKESIDGQLD
jgi:hypothetical protein